jgi:hypothetical protein
MSADNLSRVPACAGNAAPPAPTVSTGAGGGNFDGCPHCATQIVTETATFRDYGCGSSWAEGVGFEASAECVNRQDQRDAEADDEINRRRMGRHFESQHLGT